MSGPHTEDPIYGMTDDEVQRVLHREMTQIEREADLITGLHHKPPRTMPPVDDDDEGVGAEDGE